MTKSKRHRKKKHARQSPPTLVEEAADDKPHHKVKKRHKSPPTLVEAPDDKTHHKGKAHSQSPPTTAEEDPDVKPHHKVKGKGRRKHPPTLVEEVPDDKLASEHRPDPKSKLDSGGRNSVDANNPRTSDGAAHHHQGSKQRKLSYPFDGEVLPPNAPTGLKELSQAGYLLLHRHIEGNDRCMVCGEVLNYFDIVDATGNKVYRAFEGPESYCNSIFPAFSIYIQEIDVDGEVGGIEEVAKYKKVFHRFSHKRYIKVFSPADFYIGAVKQNWCSRAKATFILIDYAGTNLIEIVVHRLPFSRSRESKFELRNITSGLLLGSIDGQYHDPVVKSGLGEYKYEIKFPKKLNCNIKLLLVAAWLIIYKLYFDKALRKELKSYRAEHPQEKSKKKTNKDLEAHKHFKNKNDHKKKHTKSDHSL